MIIITTKKYVATYIRATRKNEQLQMAILRTNLWIYLHECHLIQILIWMKRFLSNFAYCEHSFSNENPQNRNEMNFLFLDNCRRINLNLKHRKELSHKHNYLKFLKSNRSRAHIYINVLYFYN